MDGQDGAYPMIEIVRSDYSGGKRLYERAHEVADECGHRVLDPIHLVFVAITDPHASRRAREVMVQYGIELEHVEAVLAHMEIDYTTEAVVSIHEGEYLGLDAVCLYYMLRRRFNAYVDGREKALQGGDKSTWCNYTEQLKVALESDAASIAQLHQRALQARS